MKWFFSTLGVVGLLTSATSAFANGRFPSAGHIEVDPADPAHIVVRATYGLVVTRDAGHQWNWVCEKEMSYTGVWDPPIGIMTGGVILAGLPDGLSVSTPDACGFARASALENKFVADLAVDKKNPARAVVLISTPLGMTFDTRVFLTEDSGATFVQMGTVFPENLRGLTIDLCPSDSNAIYVSGLLAGSSSPGVVFHSTDGGNTYESSILPNSDEMHGPFIGGVDPENANRVYVRLDGTPGRLFVSEDGSKTWQELFSGEGTLLGFGLSPDGKTLVVGGEKDGVWRSPVPNWAFEQTSLLHSRCFRWVDAGIYACAEPVLDGFSVGLSITEGSTFKEAAKVSDLCGPVSCSKPICISDWPTLRDIIGATPCTGSSSSSSASSSSGSGGMGGSGGNGNITPANSSGCACRVVPQNDGDEPWLISILIALGLRRRRASTYFRRIRSAA